MPDKEKDRGICLSFLYALLDLLYPRLCVVCRKSLTRGERFLCTDCLYDFPFSDVYFSSKRELFAGLEEEGCSGKIYSLFYYNKFSDYKNLIHAVKYRSRKELGVFLGRMLGERLRGMVQVDGIVPVPLHPEREKKRGFKVSRIRLLWEWRRFCRWRYGTMLLSGQEIMSPRPGWNRRRERRMQRMFLLWQTRRQLQESMCC